MNITAHARERWNERFPGLCIEDEYSSSSRAGKSIRKKIADSCPAHRSLVTNRFSGYYYRVAKKANAIFVCCFPEVVITVLVYRRPGSGRADP